MKDKELQVRTLFQEMLNYPRVDPTVENNKLFRRAREIDKRTMSQNWSKLVFKHPKVSLCMGGRFNFYEKGRRKR